MLHLGHLGPGADLQGVGRAGVPGGVPDAAEALALGPGTVDAGGAAAAADDGLGLEDVDLVVPHREADHAGNAGQVVGIEQRVGDEDPLVEVTLAERVLGRLGHDRLVGLAVDHDLPAALTLVVPVLVLEDRQPPLLEHVDGGVDVAGEVVDEVLPGQAHQVLADVADELLRGVLAPLHAHVHVDGRQAHGHRAGALDGGLVD